MERDYGQEESHEYRGRGYGNGRDLDRDMGRDYCRGSFNRDRGGFFDPLDRSWRGVAAGSRGTMRNWEIEDDWDEEAEVV